MACAHECARTVENVCVEFRCSCNKRPKYIEKDVIYLFVCSPCFAFVHACLQVACLLRGKCRSRTKTGHEQVLCFAFCDWVEYTAHALVGFITQAIALSGDALQASALCCSWDASCEMSASTGNTTSPPHKQLLRDSISLNPSQTNLASYAEVSNVEMEEQEEVEEPLNFEPVTAIHNVRKLASYGYEYGYKEDQLSPRSKCVRVPMCVCACVCVCVCVCTFCVGVPPFWSACFCMILANVLSVTRTLPLMPSPFTFLLPLLCHSS